MKPEFVDFPSCRTTVVVRQRSSAYIARAGKGGYARSASSTNSAYLAARAAAAKFFRVKEDHVVVAYQADKAGIITFEARNHQRRVQTLRVEFEDRGQDFLGWEIVRDDGQVIDCWPFQYTTWAQCRVTNVQDLAVGVRPSIETSTGERLTLNYAITAISEKGGAK